MKKLEIEIPEKTYELLKEANENGQKNLKKEHTIEETAAVMLTFALLLINLTGTEKVK